MNPDGTLVPVGQVTGTMQTQQPQQQWKDNSYAAPQQQPTSEPGIKLDTTGKIPTENIVPQPSVWEKGFSSGLKESGTPLNKIGEAINSYNEWATKNGKDPVDFASAFQEYHSYDPSKSVEQNEADEKKAKRTEDWEKFGNFLQHFGNFVGTLNGGTNVPIETADNLTKRQQLLKDRTMAQRDSSWQRIYQTYKNKKDNELKQKSAELAAKREARQDAESQSRIAKNEAYANYQKAVTDKNTEEAAYWKAKADALEKGLPLDQALKEAKIAAEKARANASNAAANKSKAEADNVGKGKTTTTTYKRNASGDIISSERHESSNNAKKALPGVKKKLPGKK